MTARLPATTYRMRCRAEGCGLRARHLLDGRTPLCDWHMDDLIADPEWWWGCSLLAGALYREFCERRDGRRMPAARGALSP